MEQSWEDLRRALKSTSTQMLVAKPKAKRTRVDVEEELEIELKKMDMQKRKKSFLTFCQKFYDSIDRSILSFDRNGIFVFVFVYLHVSHPGTYFFKVLVQLPFAKK